MKTLGIILGALGITALLGWIVLQTLSLDTEERSYNMHPSNFEKPNTEKTIDFQSKEEETDSLPDLNDLLDDKDS